MSSFCSSVLRTMLALAFALTALAACGGGGGGSGSTPPVAVEPDPTLPAVDLRAVAAADPGSTLPALWHRGAFMEIFVRSYKDSDGDGVGDLRGLIAQLDLSLIHISEPTRPY